MSFLAPAPGGPEPIGGDKGTIFQTVRDYSMRRQDHAVLEQYFVALERDYPMGRLWVIRRGPYTIPGVIAWRLSQALGLLNWWPKWWSAWLLDRAGRFYPEGEIITWRRLWRTLRGGRRP